MSKIFCKMFLLLGFVCLWCSTFAFAVSDDRTIKRNSKSNVQRSALVIGNSTYKDSPLKNPVNDAKDIAKALEQSGFTVKLLKNANQREMEESIRSFGKGLRTGGVGLFYFAGHGIQHQNRNYLVPVGARIDDEADVKYEAVDASLVLSKMEVAGNDVNIVILDACRNNPFARSFRSAEKGLAQMDAPTGSLVAYATSPGSVAADGTGRNGVYTKYLLRYINKPGLTIEQVFKRVRQSVLRDTGNKQTPWESSSLVGDFSFQRGLFDASSVTVSSTLPSSATENDSLFWESIQVSNNPAMFQAYLDQFPNGIFANLATLKLENLTVSSTEKLQENGITTTASGLQFRVVKEGKGSTPTANSTVKVHYKGTLLDGTEFDNSYKRGQPAKFGVNQVIPGWTEALQLMKVGSVFKLHIPPDLAYGASGIPPNIPPDATLVFEVELLDTN